MARFKLITATITIFAPTDMSDAKGEELAETLTDQLALGLMAVGDRIKGSYGNGKLTYDVEV